MLTTPLHEQFFWEQLFGFPKPPPDLPTLIPSRTPDWAPANAQNSLKATWLGCVFPHFPNAG